MSHTELFDHASKDAQYKAVAIKIMDKLRELRQGDTEAAARRWGWELLQNAKDVAYRDSAVRVAFTLEEGVEPKVIVEHSGRPFRTDELYYLIVQTSSKERPDDGSVPKSTGRYGTGFITTHLLSPIIDVGGLLQAPKSPALKFSLTLDRSGRTIDALIESVKQTLSIREKFDELPSVKEFDPHGYNTSFTYRLNTEGLAYARKGLADLRRSLPLTLAFTREVGEVVLRPGDHRFTVDRREEIQSGVSLVDIVESINDESTHYRFLMVRGEKTSLAVSVDVRDDSFRVLPLHEKVPRLFCDFPLIGSEAFPSPVAINSSYFFPNDSRSGLFLSDESDPPTIENRGALEEIPELLERLIRAATTMEANDIVHLAAFGSTEFGAKANAWYEKHVLSTIRTMLVRAPIVELRNGERGSLRNDENGPAVFLPFDSDPDVREKIWQFASAFIEKGLPTFEHIHLWSNVARVWSDCPTLRLDELVAFVSKKGNLSKLSELLKQEPAASARWLNQFVVFLSENDQSRYLRKRGGGKSTSLLPNQLGDFRLMDDLLVDDELDETLKDIAADLGKNYREFLLDKRFTIDIPGRDRSRDNHYLAQEIDDLVRSKIKARDKSEDTRRAFRELYQWFEKNDVVAQDLFKGLYADRHLLIPPDEALELMRQASRVPALEHENSSLKAQLNEKQLETARLQNTIDELKGQIDSAGDGSESYEEAAARVLGANLTEAWEKVKEVLGKEGDAAKLRSVRDLDWLLENHPKLFEHVSEAAKEAFIEWIVKVDRAKGAVKATLAQRFDYDIKGWDEVPAFPTIVQGVTRHGREIQIVIRPADGGFIILYEQLERDVLEDPDAELWIEGDGIGPERFNIGKLANRLGVNRLPVRSLKPRPAVIYLS